MIVKEFRCKGHGIVFDSYEESPACPKGCTSTEQVFITPRGLIGHGTKNIDATFRTLANDFGLSDMNASPSRSNSNGAARVKTPQQLKAEQMQEKLRVRFGGAVPKGGTYHAGDRKVIGGGAGQGALAALAAQGAPETTVFSDLKPDMQEFRRGVVVTKDPDKESSAKVRAA